MSSCFARLPSSPRACASERCRSVTARGPHHPLLSESPDEDAGLRRRPVPLRSPLSPCRSFRTMPQRPYLTLAFFLIVTFAAGAIGSAATFENVRSWYPSLNKPSWNPPGWIFGPVWSCLYTAMAVAAWRVWRIQIGSTAPSVWRVYGTQLGLNALWSLCFFAWRRPDLALLDIAALWTLLVFTLVRFWRIDRVAGWLWAPYVAWVSFAAVLNATIYGLNRS